MMNEGGEEMGQAEEEDDSDPRLCIKITSWIVLFFGIVVGIWGLVYVIMELSSGDAKEDSADWIMIIKLSFLKFKTKLFI